MSARDVISSAFIEVAAEQNRQLAPPEDSTRLIDLELDSLSMAVIIARLEDRLGTDPFTRSDEIPYPETFGDFVALYAQTVPA